MMNLNNNNELLLNDIINYVYVKQNQLNTNFKVFPKTLRELEKK